MKFTETTDCPNFIAIGEDVLVSRIAKILESCERSKNLMIGIYLIKKEQFLYCNHHFKNILGKNYHKLLDEGWPFWFSRVDVGEVPGIRERVTNFLTAPYALEPLTLRYHISDLKGKQICVKHEILLHRIADRTLAINYLFDVSDKERIEKYFAMSERPDRSNFSLDHCFHVSEREKEVLQLIANGFSSKEIADMLFISNHTAISHRKNLIEKFQVKNTAHLITRAMGLIDL